MSRRPRGSEAAPSRMTTPARLTEALADRYLIQRELADRAWARLRFTSDIALAPIAALVAEAQSVGFLKDAKDLSRLMAPQP